MNILIVSQRRMCNNEVLGGIRAAARILPWKDTPTIIPDHTPEDPHRSAKLIFTAIAF